MLIQIVAIVAFAALFALFLLLSPADDRGACHNCAGRDAGGGCDMECPLLREAGAETLTGKRSA
jgi:hypothetical protein